MGEAPRADQDMHAGDRHAERQLAQLCVRLAARNDVLASSSPLNELAMTVVAGVRDGRDPAEFADAFDELDDMLLRMGYAAGLGTYRSGTYSPLPGVEGGHPVLHVLACPARRCPRVELPAADRGQDAVCQVFGERLARVRIQR